MANRIVALVIVVSGGIASCGCASCPYPNEARGFQFWSSAPWRELRPLESTMADVRRVLGDPNEAHDIDKYTAPYPGDEKAIQPVWRYNLNEDWDVLVYFVKSSYFERRKFPEALYDRLHCIDYLPTLPTAFDVAPVRRLFKRTHTTAADAAWDEYADGSGLVYKVYTTSPPFGGNKPGDLNRITYGPSDEDIKKQAVPTVR